jgi:TalC/MipB family fructose-6-phosphate aldolase
MELFIDSADPAVLLDLLATGIFSGVTTNPIILARARIGPEALVDRIRDLLKGDLFIQARGQSAEDMAADAGRLDRLMPARVIVKIPSTREGFKAMAALEKSGVRTAATALFTTGQGLAAARAGASVIIPFFDRLEKSGGHAGLLIEDLSRLQDLKARPRVLAASIKTMAQIETCFRAGLWAVTLPPDLALEMMESRLTEEAVEKFNDAASQTDE